MNINILKKFNKYKMGCQCANSNDEVKNEVLKKESLSDGNEEEQEDNNNYDQKEGIFGLTNQDGTEHEKDPYQFHGQSNQQNEEEYNDRLNEEKKTKYGDYPQKMVEIINRIREDPASYADVIEDSIQNILEDQDKDDANKIKIIYKKKVKVALTRGKPAFIEAAEKLRHMAPLPPLEYREDICIPLPETEEEIRDSSYLKEQVRIIRETQNIDVFFKDLIKIPEVSGLLMIVDDSGKNPGRKRQAVLNKDYRYIGINSKFIGKTFIAYFSFSK